MERSQGRKAPLDLLGHFGEVTEYGELPNGAKSPGVRDILMHSFPLLIKANHRQGQENTPMPKGSQGVDARGENHEVEKKKVERVS